MAWKALHPALIQGCVAGWAEMPFLLEWGWVESLAPAGSSFTPTSGRLVAAEQKLAT